MNADKNSFGYPAPEVPCRVCGGFKNNQSEPRFGYVVCEDHQDVQPIHIPLEAPKRGKKD
jgi:hypothetical protein